MTVTKAMLNNDLRYRALTPRGPPPRIHGVRRAGVCVCQSQSSLTAKRRPSSSVIIIAVAGARLRGPLQGVFYARPVNSGETRRAESRTSEFV